MSRKIYHVRLGVEERSELEALLVRKKGQVARSKLQRARILLAADEGHKDGALSDETIARALKVSVATVERTRQTLVEEGLKVAVHGRPNPRIYTRMIDGQVEAHLIALSCQKPPAGHSQWSLSLLGEALVEAKFVQSVHNSTLCRALKKTS
jgi:hypothetical protein